MMNVKPAGGRPGSGLSFPGVLVLALAVVGPGTAAVRAGDADDADLLTLGGPLIAAHPLVLAELQLDPDRADRVRSLVRDCRRLLEGLPDRVASYRRDWEAGTYSPYRRGPLVPPGVLVGEADEQARADLRGRLAAELGRARMARLEELMLQARGLRAFADPALHKRLFLTPTQTRAVSMLLDERKRGVRDEVATFEALFGILTRTQAEVWTKLAGRPLSPPFSAGYAAAYARLNGPGGLAR